MQMTTNGMIKPVFKVSQTVEEILQTLLVRAIVFMEEQHTPFREEIDGYDFSSVHVLGTIDCEPMAAGRIRYFDNHAKLERIAIRKAYRGYGFGHKLVEYLIGIAKNEGFSKIKLHAQYQLRDFYASHGFIPHGNRFEEAGIDHILMILDGSA